MFLNILQCFRNIQMNFGKAWVGAELTKVLHPIRKGADK